MAKKAKRKTARKSAKQKSKRRMVKRKTAKRAAAKRKTAKRKAKRRVKRDDSPAGIRRRALGASARKPGRIEREFDRAVNMTPAAISKWLKTKQSREVGWVRKKRAGEPMGHWSGRRIIEIKKKKQSELTRDDYRHMRKVSAFVKRHAARRPGGDVRTTPWRYSLMNWGHDPLKRS